MSDEGPGISPNPGYIAGLIDAALFRATSNEDPAVRARAEAQLARFEAVLEGMRSGALSIGSRTPVGNTPAWVTLEVVKGGFATGALLANGPLKPHELAALATISPVTAPTRGDKCCSSSRSRAQRRSRPSRAQRPRNSWEQKAPFRNDSAPAVRGLALVIEGGRFEADGSARWKGDAARRFLGWTIGRHWLFGAKP